MILLDIVVSPRRGGNTEIIIEAAMAYAREKYDTLNADGANISMTAL